MIRKPLSGPVVNIWLILNVAVGAIIALADGLTRTPVSEREAFGTGSLQYQPYGGALWLAVISLVLMFGYVRVARIPMTEGMFLWFVFCTAAYTKDFSYLRWPSQPVFVTDIVLMILLLSVYLVPRAKPLRVPVPVNVLLVFVLAAGMVSAVRGFLERRDTILLLRDTALVEYPLFLYVAHHVFRNWLAIKRMGLWFLLGTSLSVLNGLAWFLVAPQERRFMYYGIYVLIALVGTFVILASRFVPSVVGWPLIGLFGLGLALANARSLFVALPFLLVLGLCGGALTWRKTSRARLAATTLVATSVLIAAVAFLFLHTEAGRDFAGRSAQELVSGVFDSKNDMNWQFRLVAWNEAWRRFEQDPLVGEGFGVPFTFDIWDNDPRPHNTFLTVLYKLGLIGFLPLFTLLAYFFWCGLRAIHRNSENRRVAFLEIMILAQSSFCLYGTTNLLLESPFLASLFWAGMGIGLRMIQMLDFERIGTGVHRWPLKEQKHFLEVGERRSPLLSKYANVPQRLS